VHGRNGINTDAILKDLNAAVPQAQEQPAK